MKLDKVQCDGKQERKRFRNEGLVDTLRGFTEIKSQDGKVDTGLAMESSALGLLAWHRGLVLFRAVLGGQGPCLLLSGLPSRCTALGTVSPASL